MGISPTELTGVIWGVVSFLCAAQICENSVLGVMQTWWCTLQRESPHWVSSAKILNCSHLSFSQVKEEWRTFASPHSTMHSTLCFDGSENRSNIDVEHETYILIRSIAALKVKDCVCLPVFVVWGSTVGHWRMRMMTRFYISLNEWENTRDIQNVQVQQVDLFHSENELMQYRRINYCKISLGNISAKRWQGYKWCYIIPLFQDS